MPLIYPFRPSRFAGASSPGAASGHLVYPFRPSRFAGPAAAAATPRPIYPFRPWRSGPGAAAVVIPTASIVPTDPAVVMLALQATLYASGLFGPAAANRVKVSLDREPWPYTGNCVYLMPGPQSPDMPVVVGGGRRAQLYRGEFTVRFVARSVRDAPGTDDYRLTNPGTLSATPGLFAMARMIANVFSTEFLLDGSGNFLSVEPIDPGEIRMPSRYGQDLLMAGIDIDFRIAYLMNLSVAPTD
jgi:hypothetical protein